jgi:GNAT superfamily N-acetyltransferase
MRSDPLAARHHYVTEIDGKIVVMLLRILRRIRMRGGDFLAKDGVDAAVDPRYRSQGLYAALADFARADSHEREADLGCGFSSNPWLQPRTSRFGNRPLANRIQVLEKPYRARAIVNRRQMKYGGRWPASLAVLEIKLRAAFNRMGHPPYLGPAKLACSIATAERFDERIQGFFDEAAKPFDFLVVRSKDYLNWRYCKPAGGHFTVRIAERQGKMLGYLVLKISERTGYIADLLALPGRFDVVRSLIEDALGLFRDAEVEMVSCWMISRHPYNGILRRYGFLDSKRDVGFRCRPITIDYSELELLDDPRARVHLCHGDSDWI